MRIEDELLSKMQATIFYDHDQESWAIQDGYQGSQSTNGTWVYINEEIPVKNGMLFKTNHTFLQAHLD